MVAMYLAGIATGAAMVLEFQKKRSIYKENKRLKAALSEVQRANRE